MVCTLLARLADSHSAVLFTIHSGEGLDTMEMEGTMRKSKFAVVDMRNQHR